MAAETVHLRRDPAPDGNGGVVAVLELDAGGKPVVVLNRALLAALDAALDELEAAMDGVRGVVLASASAKVFVAGADLGEIMALSDDELHAYLELGTRVYGRLSALPVRTVAAINGAALGGGLELAMHCDTLIGAEPAGQRAYPVGLPEAGLRICPGWGGTVLLPARMEPADAIVATATGKPMDARSAATAGVLEELVPAERLLDRARELARGAKPNPAGEPRSVARADLQRHGREGLAAAKDRLPDAAAARAVAGCVEAGVERGWAAAVEAEQRELVRLRNTPEGREAIEAFFAKSAAKK